MNSSVGEEILSTAGVPETNQVTEATVTTTSTTNTQICVRYVYKKRGLKFDILGNEFISR